MESSSSALMSSPGGSQSSSTDICSNFVPASAAALTPDRHGDIIDPGLAQTWGSQCFRCHQHGHWYNACPVGSKVIKARYRTLCDGCKGWIDVGDDICKQVDGGPWVHLRCELGQREVEAQVRDATKRRLNFSPDDAPDPADADADADADPIHAINRCVDDPSGGHIGVNASAGSGKTWLITEVGKRLRLLGCVVKAITLNRDAARELRARGFTEASTFHSVGWHAWSNRGKLVHDDEEEEDEEADASESSSRCVQSKVQLLLQLLFPGDEEREAHADGAERRRRQQRRSLEYVLFEPFVSHMVRLAKMGGLGIDENSPSDNEIDDPRGTGWRQLQRLYKTQSLIETVLEKRMSESMREEALELWPSPLKRLEAGLRITRQVFHMSIESAISSKLQLGDGRVVSELGSGKSRYRHKLPLIDFDDLLYMPVKLRLPLRDKPLDWLFIDEAQDTSRIRLIMAQRMLEGTEGRLFVVGDNMQALYGWAGADPDALKQLMDSFNCTEFTLPVCRRCPTSHIDLANEVITEVNEQFGNGGSLMQPMPGAAEGSITRGADFKTQPLQPKEVSLVVLGKRKAAARGDEKPATTAILARMNAPLLACLYALAARAIPCEMLGRTPLSKRLLKLVKELKSPSLEHLEFDLSAHVSRQQQARATEGRGSDASLLDLAACIGTLVDELVSRRGVDRSCAEGVALLEREIESSFGAEPQPPDLRTLRTVLATVHKAKGLGWTRVYLLQPKDLPLSWVAEGCDWEARQERNVEYVALTRSYEQLIFLKHFNPREVGLRAGVEALFGDGGAGSRRRAAGRAAAGPQHQPAQDSWDEYRSWHRQRRRREEPQRPAHGERGLDDDSNRMTRKQALEHLGLSTFEGLTRELLAQAFRAAVLKAHPDRAAQTGIDPANANETTQLVYKARETLLGELLEEGAEADEGN